MGILNDITASIRLLTGLRRFLRRTVSLTEARETVARRLETRDEAFLNLVRTRVYENPSSPYLPLLKRAQCGLGDIAEGVRRHGVEEELRRLAEAGVHVTFEEYRGRVPLVRGDLELRLTPEDFDNPRGRAGLRVTTGGSTGKSVQTKFDLDLLTERVAYDALIFEMLDLRGVPLALWYPQLPAVTGISNSLRYAKLGEPARRWFDLLAGREARSAWDCRAMTSAIVWASRLTPNPLARPEPMGMKRADGVLDWALDQVADSGRCAVQGYVSQALRLCREARVRGVRLDGVQFLVGSEPMTRERESEILRSGAGVYSRYMATEVGTIGLGCPESASADSLHAATDTIALVQKSGEDGRPFYITSMLESVPKVFLNVALGDGGEIVREPCGCLLGAMGLDTHVKSVRSTTRVSCEGMTVAVADLLAIVEESVRPKYGGGALDYQWVERSGTDGLGHLRLRVDPDVGPVDADALVGDILSELSGLGRGHRMMASAWKEAGTIRVVREKPCPTARGKMPPMVHEEQAG